jgi:endonuclease/exonuclease/phosphatase family metal-dependent hydrolase
MRTWIGTLSIVAAACASVEPNGPSSQVDTHSYGRSGGASTAAAPLPAEPSGPTMKVATYNVNFGLAGDASVLDAVSSLGADMVFLQETNAAWQASFEERFASSHPHIAFKHCCNAGGLGVMSRYPVEAREYVHPEGAWFPAWRILADTPLGRVQVINVHLRPNVSDGGSVVSGLFTTPPIRLAEMERYAELIDPDLPAIVVGDFNESYEGPALLHLSERGMKSALAERYGLKPTWHWPTPLGELKKQFDHIVIGPELSALTVDVLERGSSDHFPVVATLARTTPAK